MDPYSTDGTRLPLTQRFSRQQLLVMLGVGIVILFLIIIFVMSFFNRPHGLAEYKIQDTSLHTSQNFGYLNGNDLYAYNGLAFYKTDLDDGNTTVLTAGLRLPTAATVDWANTKGALMTFSQSYSQTVVEQKLNSLSQAVNDDTQQYLWYVDFTSGQVKVVNSHGLIPGTAVWSEKDNGFYYASHLRSTDYSIFFYDIGKDTSKVIGGELDLASVTNVVLCGESKTVCVVGADNKNPESKKLYSIGSDGKIAQVFDAKGGLYPTNNDHLFITIPRDAPAQNGDPDEDVDSDYSPLDAYMYNSQTKNSEKLGVKLTGPEINTALLHNNTYFLFDSSLDATFDSKEARNYVAGNYGDNSANSTQKKLIYKDGKNFTGNISQLRGANESVALVGTLDDQQYLFTDETNLQLPAAQKQDVAENAVKSCLSSGAITEVYFESTKTFRIMISDDANFYKNIGTFSKCITNSGAKTLIGYNYQFAGQDPINGRITTD